MDIIKIVKDGFGIGMVQQADELTGLFAILAVESPRNFLEIGTLHGGVFYGLTQVCRGKAISVDIPTPGVDIEWRNTQMRGWTQPENLHIIMEDSHKLDTFYAVQDALAGERLGFLFIDGDHSYVGVRDDYFMYSQLVREGGLIAFHDINDSQYHRDANCFVSQFWNELKGEKIVLNSGGDCCGIGIIRKM